MSWHAKEQYDAWKALGDALNSTGRYGALTPERPSARSPGTELGSQPSPAAADPRIGCARMLRPIYYSICPHALAPDSGTAAAWHNQSFAPCSDAGVVYSPPAICKRPSPRLGGIAMQELSS